MKSRCSRKLNHNIMQEVEFLRRSNIPSMNISNNNLDKEYISLCTAMEEVCILNNDIEVFNNANIDGSLSTHKFRLYKPLIDINVTDYIRIKANNKLLIIDSNIDEEERGMIIKIKATLQGINEI